MQAFCCSAQSLQDWASAGPSTARRTASADRVRTSFRIAASPRLDRFEQTSGVLAGQLPPMGHDDGADRLLIAVRAHPDIGAGHPDLVAFRLRAGRAGRIGYAKLVIADFPAPG